jgi:hypothetical protein
MIKSAVPFVECEAAIIGTDISAIKCVLDDVVAPAADPTDVATVERYTRSVVATEFVAAALATTAKRTNLTRDPFEPAKKAEYIKSVPVPALVPSLLTCADVVPISTVLTLMTFGKIGFVLAGIDHLKMRCSWLSLYLFQNLKSKQGQFH